MGTDLIVIGNHRIAFEGRSYEALSTAITAQLKSLNLVNAPYLQSFALQSWQGSPRKLREILTETEWTVESEDSEYYDFSTDRYLGLSGPHGLHFQIDAYEIQFSDPPARYGLWYHPENAAFRNEWRKYFHQIVHCLGGDRVIYLADNAHSLDGYWNTERRFEVTEAALAAAFGPPQTNFKVMEEKKDDSYMTDTLEDMDWDSTLTIDTAGIDDRVNTAINLKRYNSRTTLMQLPLDDEDIRHRADEKGHMHYEHTGRWQGLMFRQGGLVDSEDWMLEVWLDAYAPFSFDANIERLKAEGWSTLPQVRYALHFGSADDYWRLNDWLQGTLYMHLRWYTGNGQAGGSSRSDGSAADYLQAVSLPSLINSLRQLNDSGPYNAAIQLQHIDEPQTIVWEADPKPIKVKKRWV